MIYKKRFYFQKINQNRQNFVSATAAIFNKFLLFVLMSHNRTTSQKLDVAVERKTLSLNHSLIDRVSVSTLLFNYFKM